jgi:hypothetical protein
VWNHKQFSGVGTTQYYFYNVGINATQGQHTSARPPRIEFQLGVGMAPATQAAVRKARGFEEAGGSASVESQER